MVLYYNGNVEKWKTRGQKNEQIISSFARLQRRTDGRKNLPGPSWGFNRSRHFLWIGTCRRWLKRQNMGRNHQSRWERRKYLRRSFFQKLREGSGSLCRPCPGHRRCGRCDGLRSAAPAGNPDPNVSPLGRRLGSDWGREEKQRNWKSSAQRKRRLFLWDHVQGNRGKHAECLRF